MPLHTFNAIIELQRSERQLIKAIVKTSLRKHRKQADYLMEQLRHTRTLISQLQLQ